MGVEFQAERVSAASEAVSAPDILEVLLPDINGVLRGKWLPGRALEKVTQDGVPMPLSLFGLDIWGREVMETEIHLETGDRDGLCKMVPGSLKPVPWSLRPTQQALVTMHEPDGTPWVLDPRHVLKAIVERMARKGLTPVVAFELEFYLLKTEANEAGAPRTVYDRASGPARQNMYSMSDLDDFSPVLHDMREAARLQGLPTDTIMSEAAPGQFEINLYHRADPMAAADDAVLLKRMIQGVARKHGLRATFMAKPYLDLAGSGMHVHCSLLDKAGKNIFAEPGSGEARLRHAIAGLLDSMIASSIVFVSGFNGFRRLAPGTYAPTSLSWGYDNRCVALRIPNSKPAARRVEHRIAGADANPYLVLAAILAGIDEGLDAAAEPPPPLAGNAYEIEAVRLSPLMTQAVADFRASDFVTRNFGASFQRVYSVMKQAEAAEFERRISRLEYDTYL